jgi:hypothetical protein
MTSKAKNDSKSSPDEAVTKAVTENPGATIEGIAQQAGIARSTAGKVLGRLAGAGEMTRHDGGRDGRKRLPDRFTMQGVVLPAAYAKHVGDAGTDTAAKATSGGKPSKAKPAAASPSGKPAAASASGKPDRLKAGGLEPLVMEYLENNKSDAPHGPSKVAKALGRSSGAVGNCLARLAEAKKTKRVGDKPVRYDLAA